MSTYGDKKLEVLAILEEEGGLNLSCRELGRRCGVSHTHAANIRIEYQSTLTGGESNADWDKAERTMLRLLAERKEPVGAVKRLQKKMEAKLAEVCVDLDKRRFLNRPRKLMEHLDSSCMVAYRGPSLYNGEEIRVVAFSLKYSSGNRKTGDMMAVSIILDGVKPTRALKTGQSVAVCGDCPHRKLSTCYVPLLHYGDKPWLESSMDADISAASKAISQVAQQGVPLRVGAYGNISAAPFAVVEKLVEATRVRGLLQHTSYISDWQTADPRHARYSMASVQTPMQREAAKALGYRTYRCRLPEESVLDGEVSCPAGKRRKDGHKVTCADCKWCSGTEGRGKMDVVVEFSGSANQVEKYREHCMAVSSST